MYGHLTTEDRQFLYIKFSSGGGEGEEPESKKYYRSLQDPTTNENDRVRFDQIDHDLV